MEALEKAQEESESTGLLNCVANGSEQAFRDLYERFHARVYAFALNRLNDPAEAADVLNEVMLEVWRNAGRFEGRSKVLTWVLGIAHHKVIDKLRVRNDQLVEEVDPEFPDEDNPTALAAMVGAEDAERVRRCLDTLPDKNRLVVHLAFFEDLTYAEIAKIANCPVGTVKTRMLRAKQLLKRCLRDSASGDVG